MRAVLQISLGGDVEGPRGGSAILSNGNYAEHSFA